MTESAGSPVLDQPVVDPGVVDAFRRQILRAETQKLSRQMQERTGEDVTGEIGQGDLRPAVGGAKMLERGRDKVTIYHVATGEASQCLYYMVADKCTMVGPDGKYIWTINPAEAATPHRGTYKCQLHPEHPDREWLDSIGLAGIECTKDNIPTVWQVREHARKKHNSALEAIKEAEARREREEDREAQRVMREAMQALAAQNAPRRRRGEEDGAA